MARSEATPAFPLLHVHSHYSFLSGVDGPEDMAQAGADAGYAIMALTDHMSLSGGVRFVRTAQEKGIRPLVGCEVPWRPDPVSDAAGFGNAGSVDAVGAVGTVDGGRGRGDRVLLVAENPGGYRSLSRLLTRARSTDRMKPYVTWSELAQAGAESGILALLGTRRSPLAQALLSGETRGFDEACGLAHAMLDLFGADHVALVMERLCLPGEKRLEAGLDAVAKRLHIPVVAAPPVHHRRREDLWLHDLVTCLREGITVEDPSLARPLNAEGYLASPAAMMRRYADRPDAVSALRRIAERLEMPFQVPSPKPRMPRVVLPAGVTAAQALKAAITEGSFRRYGPVLPAGLEARLESEFQVICDLGYADYFLLVVDVVAYARRAGIRVAGRGSAADSAIAYVLEITEVDAFARGLLFERFMSRERGEKPDIDLDFDARYRDEMAAYVSSRYGADHVASVGTFSTFRIRSAVRELGKTLGFAPAELDRLAKAVPDVPADAIVPSWDRYPELHGHDGDQRRFELLWRAAAALAGTPRFPSTHLGGLVISAEPVIDVAPLFRSAKGSLTMALDKDDVEDMGLMKLDLLSLRTLSALDRVERLAPGAESRIRPGDTDTYARIRRGETIGMFQLESPAQRSLQARLGAEGMEDIVHSLALIRPGPIQGNMVDPFVERRRGRAPITFLHPLLEPILAKTYGVVLFQEQVIEIAVRVAGFTPGEADRLRRVMTHGRSLAEMEAIGDLFVTRARTQGIAAEASRAIFEQLAGYASYGFSEAHAAAFAQTAYKTAYLAQHEPAALLAALLSEQPMGYYPPWILATEARRRGIAFLPADVNRSDVGCTVESGQIRIGLSLVRDMGEDAALRVVSRRPPEGYGTVSDIRARTGIERNRLEQLVRSGALDGICRNRRQTLLECGAPLGQLRLSLQSVMPGAADDELDFPEQERHQMEVEVLGFEWRPSVWQALRPRLKRLGYRSSATVREEAHGARVRCVGWPFRPHRPPTRSGRPAAFFSLVDEEGLMDCAIFGRTYETQAGVLFTRPLPPMEVEGTVSVRGEGRELVVRRVRPWLGFPGAERYDRSRLPGLR